MKVSRDSLGRGLEVEAALVDEAAWELKEAVASMAVGSLDMDVDSPPHLPVETFANRISLSWTQPFDARRELGAMTRFAFHPSCVFINDEH
ncbi:hypothetical protein PVAP13_3KG240527 [Panicum virgatum]|uniref:Uncharacterized protein n=1 Tax=Panicum virgatum TaxID=38727 RepID=A0A8T0V1N0_PANVG|nr:hypothetical protein PVAP13_3KG240527 [Panicum virgatum]